MTFTDRKVTEPLFARVRALLGGPGGRADGRGGPRELPVEIQHGAGHRGAGVLYRQI